MVTRIRNKTIFTVGSNHFDTVKEAREHIEDEVCEFFRKFWVEKQLAYSALVPFMEHILANREFLADRLGYELDLDEE